MRYSKFQLVKLLANYQLNLESNIYLLDGIITQRLLEGAKTQELNVLLDIRVAKLSNSDGMNLKTFGDLGVA